MSARRTAPAIRVRLVPWGPRRKQVDTTGRDAGTDVSIQLFDLRYLRCTYRGSEER